MVHRIFAFVGVLSLSAASLHAAVVDVSLEDFQSSGVMSYTIGGSEVFNGSSGLFRLRTANYVGPPATSGLTDPEYGFCIELFQAYTSSYEPYDVVDMTAATNPVNPLAGPISTLQRDLVRQLWALHYDPTWEAPGPYSDAQITAAIAFHASIFEILNDFDGVSLASLDLSAGNFTLVAGHILDVNDPLQELPVVPLAQTFLGDLSLSYAGPLPNLVALTNASYQDYIVEAVPELSATGMLLVAAFVVTGYGLARRRRVPAAT